MCLTMHSMCKWFVFSSLLLFGVVGAQSRSGSWPWDACSTEIRPSGSSERVVINLEPLARKDGRPRFTTVFNFSNHAWSYSFNPCDDFDLPYDNPHQGYGDGCHSVSVCKYTRQYNKWFFYSMGIHASAKFQVLTNSPNSLKVQLVYRGIKSMRARDFIILLVCDEKRTGIDDGQFTIVGDDGKGPLYAELHHLCCCPGRCMNTTAVTMAGPTSAKGNIIHKGNITMGTVVNGNHSVQPADAVTASTEKEKEKKGDGGMMLVVVGTLVAILMMVALIGGLCYVKSSHQQMYAKLPVKTHGLGQVGSSAMKTDLRDYEPSAVTRKKQLPILEDVMINFDSLEMCQRLGGGIFGDTHMAKWNEMTVAVKRLTLLVHEHQITPDAMKLMQNEVWFLSRQRHRNIVNILGLCLDGKLPSIITEFVIGECLKDFIKAQGRLLSWPHRLRMCLQVADGMAFLHSTKPPIIHRDLRCGNLFLLDNDVVKVADFGLIKLLQPVREQCPQDDCCCRRTLSACPASIRWMAPELLAHPVDKEHTAPPGGDKGDSSSKEDEKGRTERSVITMACDVYSFAMVMWELPMCQDPFQEISCESEVMKIVKNGGRPETRPSADMMPHYKELMKSCWSQVPAQRPTFKQIATRLKDLGAHARAYQKQLQNQQRMQKLQQDSVPI